jgi:hypothetical protein
MPACFTLQVLQTMAFSDARRAAHKGDGVGQDQPKILDLGLVEPDSGYDFSLKNLPISTERKKWL